MDDPPPIDDWERREVLEEILRIARGLGHEDFRQDLVPRLRRLTPAQRQQVAEAVEDTLRRAHRAGDI